MLLHPPRSLSTPFIRVTFGAGVLVLVALVPVADALAGAPSAAPAVGATPGADSLRERAVAAAERANAGSTEPALRVEVDAAVIDTLTTWRTHPTTRAWVLRGLDARTTYEHDVLAALDAAALPRQLAAVPLVESGYTNWGAPAGATGAEGTGSLAPGVPGRGLWMFIAPTARAYGLRVDAERDERFDVEKETAAAVALLTDLHDRYGAWSLALAGYNQGEHAVDTAIAQGGTRDAWALQRAGLLNDYVATVMAGALVMADPALLSD